MAGNAPKWLVRAPYEWEREQWMKNHTNFPLNWMPPKRPVRPVRPQRPNDMGKTKGTNNDTDEK